VPGGHARHQALGAIAAGHAHHISTAGNRGLGQRRQIVPELQNHRLDPTIPALLHQAEPLRLPPTTAGVDEQNRLPGRWDGVTRRSDAPPNAGRGAATTGRVCATALAKAKPDAACPEGHDAECGMGTWRPADTPARSRAGRRRRVAIFTPAFTTAESTATATSPALAARRPSSPPAAAITPAITNHSRDRSAASDTRRIQRSSMGVGVSAMAR
jgi:hypothetical protein